MKYVYIGSLAHAQELGLGEGFVFKVVDLDSKLIVGYDEGSTFDQESLRDVDRRTRTFLLSHPDDPESRKIRGVNLTAALMSIDPGIVEHMLEHLDEYGIHEVMYVDPPEGLAEAAQEAKEIRCGSST